MEVKFDLVRIGKIRKNYASEIVLKQNVDFLKNSIRTLLKEEKNFYNKSTISMVMIIPGKGYNIKIALRDIKDNHIIELLEEKFSKFIYKGKYSLIMDNINNKTFSIYQ